MSVLKITVNHEKDGVLTLIHDFQWKPYMIISEVVWEFIDKIGRIRSMPLGNLLVDIRLVGPPDSVYVHNEEISTELVSFVSDRRIGIAERPDGVQKFIFNNTPACDVLKVNQHFIYNQDFHNALNFVIHRDLCLIDACKIDIWIQPDNKIV